MKEAGTTHWQSANTGATNESGFSGLPGGYRVDNGSYYYIGGYAYFWSSTGEYNYSAWSRGLSYYSSGVYRSYAYRLYGFSLRCVKD